MTIFVYFIKAVTYIQLFKPRFIGEHLTVISRRRFERKSQKNELFSELNQNTEPKSKSVVTFRVEMLSTWCTSGLKRSWQRSNEEKYVDRKNEKKLA